jgi:hypothetical protein
MNTKLGLTILSAACLGLAGCLNGDVDAENRAADAKRVSFIEQTAPVLGKAAAEEFPIGGNQNEIIAQNLEKIGCPKLAKLFRDMMDFQGTEDKPLPTSFTDYLSCFGVSGSGTLDDIDVVWEKFDDPEALLECICGGTGMTDYLNSVNFQWSVFQGAASTAAGSAFSGASSSSSGGGFSGSSSSSSGGGFDGSSSSASGSSFSGN